MSLLLQAMTTDDDKEIDESLKLVLHSSRLGLVHESTFIEPTIKKAASTIVL